MISTFSYLAAKIIAKFKAVVVLDSNGCVEVRAIEDMSLSTVENSIFVLICR